MGMTYPVKIDFKRKSSLHEPVYDVEIVTPITHMGQLPSVTDNEGFPLAILQVGIEMTIDEIKELHLKVSEIITKEQNYLLGKGRVS